MKRRWIIVAALVCVLVGAPATPGQRPEGDIVDKLPALMQRKLEKAQKLLEGVALNDFDKITKSTEDLISISKAAEWRVIKTPRYETYSSDFQRVGEDIIKNAKDKNLDGVALNYVELTMTCVKCHKYVREVKMARLDR